VATRSNDLPIVGDTFNVGYRFQRYWDTPMANAFFFGELGAGIFLVAAVTGFLPGMLLGLLTTCVLKTWFHLTHMGVPSKSWRAILRPDRSWISRGLLGIVLYAGFGFAYLGLQWLGLANQLGIPAGLVDACRYLAIAAALVVATYQGFAMSHSTAIALWNTGLMPLASLAYAVTAGLLVDLVLGFGDWYTGTLGGNLHKVTLVMLGVLAVINLSLLHAAYHGSPAGRKSTELLTRSFYAQWYWGVTWLVGLALPAFLLATAAASFAATLIATLAVLAGFYSFRLLMFKAGLFEPIMSFRR